MNSACRCDFSTHITEAAPRLKHSRLNAPEPANNSKTFAPTTRSPSELKTACLTRSGVGRTSSPFGTFKIRRAALPPVMRMDINSKFQAPTSREISNFNIQTRRDQGCVSAFRQTKTRYTGSHVSHAGFARQRNRPAADAARIED